MTLTALSIPAALTVQPNSAEAQAAIGDILLTKGLYTCNYCLSSANSVVPECERLLIWE